MTLMNRIERGRNRETADLDFARSGREGSGQYPDRRGLAGAVRAEEPEQLAPTDLEGKPIHGAEGPETDLELGDSDLGRRWSRR